MKHGMTRMQCKNSTYCFVLSILGTVCWTSGKIAHGAPNIRHLEESTNPLIVHARRFDINFGAGRKTDQAKAEEFYVTFVELNPDDDLVPVVYDNLGHMYQGSVREAEKWGITIVRDDEKAYKYYRKAVESHPKGKVSGLLMDSWICAAALAPTRERRVDEYLEYYQWALS